MERLTYAEAAKILGVHFSAIAKMRRRGELTTVRRRTGALYRAEVEALAERRRIEAEACAARGPRRREPVDPRPDTDNEWLRPWEVAELIGISEQAVRKRLAVGTMPATRVGHRWWVRADQLENVERARLAQRTHRL